MSIYIDTERKNLFVSRSGSDPFDRIGTEEVAVIVEEHVGSVRLPSGATGVLQGFGIVDHILTKNASTDLLEWKKR